MQQQVVAGPRKLTAPDAATLGKRSSSAAAAAAASQTPTPAAKRTRAAAIDWPISGLPGAFTAAQTAAEMMYVDMRAGSKSIFSLDSSPIYRLIVTDTAAAVSSYSLEANGIAVNLRDLGLPTHLHSNDVCDLLQDLLQNFLPCPGNCEDDDAIASVLDAYCPRVGHRWTSAAGDNGVCGTMVDPSTHTIMRTLRAVHHKGGNKRVARKACCGLLRGRERAPRCHSCAKLRQFASIQQARLETGAAVAVVAGSRATYTNLEHMPVAPSGDSNPLVQRALNEAASAKQRKTQARKMQLKKDDMVPLRLDRMSSTNMADVIRTADTLCKSVLLRATAAVAWWCYD